MGPTNVALLKLYEAETHLREAQRKLDSATRNVRLQQRKVDDLTSRQQTTADALIKQRAKGGELDLEIKSKDEKVEHLRQQQASAQTNREYQAFLIEINTHKVDKAKIEEEAFKIMEAVDALQKETESLATQLAAESAKLVELRGSIDDRVKQLTADVEAARPLRDQAAEAVSPTARLLFERLAERYDGEAMEPIDKPHPKREEYVAMICNVDLTVDIYNRLHTRDEVIGCPSCGRLMFIPADLVPEKAVHKPKEKKARKPKGDLAAPIPLQSLAGSVVSSVDQDEDEEVVSVQVTEEDAPTTDSQ